MSNHRLRDELLELEPYPEDLKEAVREVAQLRERPLKTWERPFMVFCCVLWPIILIGSVTWLARHPDCVVKVPAAILAALPFGFALASWLLVAMVQGLKRGTWRLRDDQIAVYGGAVFVAYICAVHWCITTFNNKHLDASDVVVLIVMVVCVFWVRIEAVETRLREHMLRNELAVAKLTELVAARNADDLEKRPTS